MAKKGEKIVKNFLTKLKKNPPAGGATKEVIKPVGKKAKKVIKKIEVKKKSPAKTVAKKTKTKTVQKNLKSSFKEKIADLKLLQEQESEILESATNDILNDSRITVEKMEPLRTDRQKAVAMWTGVVFFMIVILGIWAYNLKAVFQTDATMNRNNDSSLQMKELTENMKESVGQFKESLEEIKNINNVATTTVAGRDDLFRAATSTPATTSVSGFPSGSGLDTSTSNTNLDAWKIEQLKALLEK